MYIYQEKQQQCWKYINKRFPWVHLIYSQRFPRFEAGWYWVTSGIFPNVFSLYASLAKWSWGKVCAKKTRLKSYSKPLLSLFWFNGSVVKPIKRLFNIDTFKQPLLQDKMTFQVLKSPYFIYFQSFEVHMLQRYSKNCFFRLCTIFFLSYLRGVNSIKNFGI